jgi:hypothetical protein
MYDICCIMFDRCCIMYDISCMYVMFTIFAFSFLLN